MKQWTTDFIITLLAAVFMSVLLLLTGPRSSLLLWFSGLFVGYGLRIGMVNVWPTVFKPRLAYKD